MKLVCKVEVTDRRNVSLFKQKSNRRSANSVISICGKPIQATASNGNSPDQGLFLLLVNKGLNPGVKYRLKNNVTQVFTKFVHEGKTTLRMEEPPHDLIVSEADSIQLKSFLSVLSFALKNGHLKTELISRPVTKIPTQVTTLRITKRHELPLSFKNSLTVLEMLNINLVEIPNAVLSLPNLKHLNLTHNNLKKAPNKLFTMKTLISLNMSHNEISELPVNMPISSLQTMVLCFNLVQSLPDSICNLVNLVQLEINNNELNHLPNTFWKLSRLKRFFARKNHLESVPWSISKMRLDSLDLADNPFSQSITLGFNNVAHPEFVSLLNWASAAVVRYKIPVRLGMLPTSLIRYLELCHWCACGKPVFTSAPPTFLMLDLRTVSRDVQYSCSRSVPAAVFICSGECFARFKKIG